MDCVKREFKAVGDAELIENVVEMILDGLLRDEKLFADRKSTRLNSSHEIPSRMPSSA